MSPKVCLAADAIGYPKGGGHLWVYLNWALGLRELGCDVIWLETVGAGAPTEQVRTNLAVLKSYLAPYGLADRVVLKFKSAAISAEQAEMESLAFDIAAEADLLLNMCYGLPHEIVARFRRSALIDIDPGLLQLWLSAGYFSIPAHSCYFSIGETVGQPGARFPDLGLGWQYTPPCVALAAWPECGSAPDAPFTTVSHWYMDEWMPDEAGGVYRNDKRSGFLPYLDLPSQAGQRLELALCLAGNEEDERAMLTRRGWSVRHAYKVASTPADYRRYVRASRGEFSCAKPSSVRLQSAWVSDRTLCYLASGKPAIVQHTGPSRFLPDADGLFRFRTLSEAVRALAEAEADYERHARQARALAEEHFDARKVVKKVLEKAL